SRAEALRQALAVQEELQAQLTHRALHDPLTGLGNRALLAERLADAAGRSFALLMLDLDGFKDINDTLGHPAGDALLVEVAVRLRREVSDGAVVRLGGREFAVMLAGADPGAATRAAAAPQDPPAAPFLLATQGLYPRPGRP